MIGAGMTDFQVGAGLEKRWDREWKQPPAEGSLQGAVVDDCRGYLAGFAGLGSQYLRAISA